MMRHLLIAILVFCLIAGPWLANNYPTQMMMIANTMSDLATQLAAVVMHNPRTVAGLQSKYNISAMQGTAKVKILLVPGHEPNYGGAEYSAVKERDIAVELANNLQQILANNNRYEVFVTRSQTAWSPDFTSYFNKSMQDISEWFKAYQKESVSLVPVNSNNGKPRVYHNLAKPEVALRLYGITKWANEQMVDIVIHIHLNDNPGHGFYTPGKYSGFTIYVPEKQYYNSTTTHAVAENIFRRLAKYNPVSDLSGESGGITFEPDLIAVGAYNTADAASMLIEYGYIYEQQFNNPEIRDLAIKDLAFQTYLGLQDFFDSSSAINLAKSYDTLILPHEWRPIDAQNGSAKDIYTLQTALISEGLYPPAQKSLNDCPRTGKIGPCTRTAIDAFQKKYGINGEQGIVGPDTAERLNRQFGS